MKKEEEKKFYEIDRNELNFISSFPILLKQNGREKYGYKEEISCFTQFEFKFPHLILLLLRATYSFIIPPSLPRLLYSSPRKDINEFKFRTNTNCHRRQNMMEKKLQKSDINKIKCSLEQVEISLVKAVIKFYNLDDKLRQQRERISLSLLFETQRSEKEMNFSLPPALSLLLYRDCESKVKKNRWSVV